MRRVAPGEQTGPQTSTIRADSGQRIDTRRKLLVSSVTFAGLTFDRTERLD